MCVVMESALGNIEYASADEAPSLQLDIVRDPERHQLVSANAPNATILQLLIEHRIPTIVLLDDPKEIVQFVKSKHKAQLLEHVRKASACLTLAHELLSHSGALIIDQRICSVGTWELIRGIASFYNIQLDNASFSAVLQRIAPQLAQGVDCPVKALADLRAPKMDAQLSRFEAQLVDACLGPFASINPGKPLKQTVWPAPLFLPPGNDGENSSKMADLMGRARILIFGPYLYLPRGHWQATPSFTVHHNESGNSLIVDVSDGTSVLTAGKCPLPKEGTFTCSLPFEIVDPHRPIEVRFASAQGGIEGELELHEVVMERL